MYDQQPTYITNLKEEKKEKKPTLKNMIFLPIQRDFSLKTKDLNMPDFEDFLFFKLLDLAKLFCG